MFDFLGAAFVEAEKERKKHPGACFADKDVGGLLALLGDPDKRGESAGYLARLGDLTTRTLDELCFSQRRHERLAGAASVAVLAAEWSQQPGTSEMIRRDPRWAERLTSSVETLARTVHDQRSKYRIEAVQALAWAGTEQAVAHLIDAVRSESQAVSDAAIPALVESGQAAVGPLTGALRADPDWFVRDQAALALGGIKDPSSVGALTGALNDRDRYVRARAAWALGENRDARSVDPLAAALSDEDWFVRARAAGALGEIRSRKAVPALTEALDDADTDVQRAAQSALWRLPGSSPQEIEALKGKAAQIVCEACRKRPADPRAWMPATLRRERATLAVHVPRCKECQEIHAGRREESRGRRSLMGLLVVVLCVGPCLLTNLIYRNTTGSSAIWPGIIAGVVAVIPAFLIGMAIAGKRLGGVGVESVSVSRYPKVKELTAAGWKLVAPR